MFCVSFLIRALCAKQPPKKLIAVIKKRKQNKLPLLINIKDKFSFANAPFLIKTVSNVYVRKPGKNSMFIS